MLTVTTSVWLTRGRSGRKRLDTTAPPPAVPAGRVPRVARLMALAIKFNGLLRDGVVADQSELARLARVTQPRMTQILNLLHLAPDLQEQVLFLPPVVAGKARTHERMLRPLCGEIEWDRQRAAWRALDRECHREERAGT